mmetsp:Transcript_54296/g.168584  ORF Transcript_54296/g.168584 Transcript_54296/m.168584 type:complete len:206 (-) Transcript_54296:54-671(-)
MGGSPGVNSVAANAAASCCAGAFGMGADFGGGGAGAPALHVEPSFGAGIPIARRDIGSAEDVGIDFANTSSVAGPAGASSAAGTSGGLMYRGTGLPSLRSRLTGHFGVCMTTHRQVRLMRGLVMFSSLGTRCMKCFCNMPSMVIRSPLSNMTRWTGRSPSSGQLRRSSNFRFVPSDREIMIMSRNFPWKRRSSSECQPTDMPPSS